MDELLLKVVYVDFKADFKGKTIEDRAFTTLPETIPLPDHVAHDMAQQAAEEMFGLEDADDKEQVTVSVTKIEQETLPPGEPAKVDPRLFRVLDLKKIDFSQVTDPAGGTKKL